MNTEYYKKIADLMLFGVSFKKGDKLFLQLNHDCRDAAKVLVQRAYEAGASFVDLVYIDDFVHAAAIRTGNRKLDYPEYFDKRMRETCGPGWKSVHYLSYCETDAYAGLSGDVSAEYFRDRQDAIAYKREMSLAGAFPWVLTFMPSVDISIKAFPDLSPEDAVAEYWKHIIKIMRLDEDDPVQWWKNKAAVDLKRIEYLEQLSPDYIEFKGPGTELRIGINPDVKWLGGIGKSSTGESWLANIPTDEIFTVPDCRRVDGRVALTRPLVMHQNLGDIPVNAWFEFKDGQVVDFGADKGKESLENLFKRDERAKYLGELALVDPCSPFAEPGIVFYNGLYDENAACHIALGAGFPKALKNPGNFSKDELLDMGMNVAGVHEDMMIGGSDVDVTAVGRDGKRTGLIKDGKFLI